MALELDSNATRTPFIITDPNMPVLQITKKVFFQNVSLNNITTFTEDPFLDTAFEDSEVDAVLLGVCLVAVVVTMVVLMLVFLRYMAHQKGTYYTHEEAFGLKSGSESREVQDDPEESEDESS